MQDAVLGSHICVSEKLLRDPMFFWRYASRVGEKLAPFKFGLVGP
jgi:hypothetical protein